MTRNLTKKLVSLAAALSLLLAVVIVSATAEDKPSQIVVSGATDSLFDAGGTQKTSVGDAWVALSKTIEPTEEENVFDVTLGVKAKKEISNMTVSADAAVVLVLDRSGSMNDGIDSTSTSRMNAAKAAVNGFLSSFAKITAGSETSRYVSLVVFDGPAAAKKTGSNQYWFDVAKSADLTALTEIVSGITAVEHSANTGTSIEGGLTVAKFLLTKPRTDSAAFPDAAIENRYVILFTDGAQNVAVNSSDSANLTTSGTYAAADHKLQTSECAALVTAIQSGAETYNAPIYSIAYGEANTSWLGSAGTVGTNCIGTAVVQSTNIADSFTTILNKLTLAEPWKVTDKMGQYIEYAGLPGADSNVTFNSDTKTLVWNMEALEGQAISGGEYNSWHTYKLTYRIKLDNTGDYTGSAADTAIDDLEDAEKAAANESAMLSYLVTGEGIEAPNLATAAFPVPFVRGFAAPFEFTKRVAETTTPLAGASFALYLDVDEIGDGTEPYRTATSAESTGKVYFGDLPSGHTYILKETSAPTGYEASGAEIKIKVAFGVPTFARVVRDEGEPPETTLDDIDDIDAVEVALANVANSNNIVAEPTETAPPPSGPVYVYTPTPTSSTPTSPPPTDDAGSAAPTEAPTEAPAPVSPPAAGPATEPAAEPQPSPEVIPDLPPALGQLVPQEDGSYLELDEDGVPLGAWRYDPETDEWIFDEFPPLGDFEPPPTDDELTSGSPALLLLLASVLAAAFMVSRARRARRGR